MTSSAEEIRWNLNDLFTAADDPEIENILADCRARAEAFAERVRPLMQNPQTLGAEDLLQALTELETIYEALGRVGSYAGLLYAADTANPGFGAKG
jgi:oligoendopeptidase F